MVGSRVNGRVFEPRFEKIFTIPSLLLICKYPSSMSSIIHVSLYMIFIFARMFQLDVGHHKALLYFIIFAFQ